VNERATRVTFAALAAPWVAARKRTHRSARHDIGRMHRHLIPFFGEYAPDEIDTPLLRRYLAAKRDQIGGATLQRTLALLSCFFNDLVEDGLAAENPVARLSRRTRRQASSRHDPRRVPYLRTRDDIVRVYRALPAACQIYQPYRVMFAVGVLAGLRPGELIALHWTRDVDLKRQRLHVGYQVSEGRLGPVKDDQSRVVPIVETLVPLLAGWKQLCERDDLCFPPDPRRGGQHGVPPRYRRLHTLHKHLRRALAACALPQSLTWYQCTRHTFASHWVLDGGSLETLRQILGHSTVLVTERYAHLKPDLFAAADYQRLALELGD
jgi:integrase